ncbi:hypothetical protein [Paracidovorax sp. MALMAid1276]|uniref:hypothetical protein n=1 Tax=Paracidovorax sp. MALMAid1276 TaxID=3411631 RepID=UPI003B9D255D
MKPTPPLSSTPHILSSIAGEEDPGASLDVVRNLITLDAPARPRQHLRRSHKSRHAPQIHMDCAEGAEVIGVDVGWQRYPAPRHSAADLLGLVVAHHAQIANTAWTHFNTTGQRQVALEVDEGDDGVFYVNLKDS